MGSNIVRERVAIVFITAAVVFSGVFGVATVIAFNHAKAVGTNGGAVGIATDTTGTDATGDAAGASTPGAGAAGPSGGGSTSKRTGGGSTASASRSSLATSQAESGVTKDKISVQGIFDETGAVDSSVERDTVRAYFNKVNAAGGVNGRRLELLDCDSRYDTTAATQCANSAISNKVLAVVGWTAPKGEDDQVQRLNQAGIPIIGGLGTPHEFTSPLSFPVSASFTRSGVGLAQRASELGIKHPAIVVLSDVPWISVVQKALVDALHARGIYETHVDNASGTQGSYDQDVLQMEHQDDTGHGCANPQPQPCPDAVIAALDPFSYSRLFKSMNNANWHPTILAGGLDKGTSQQDYTGQIQNANSLVPFLSPYDNADNPTVHDYLSTVKTYFPSQYNALDIYTQISWTSAMVFVEAVKRAGNNLNRQSLVDALNSIQNFDTGWSVPLTYGPGTHDPNHCFRWMKHDNKPPDQGGTWHTVSDYKCL
ncbi:MAG: ABC transporter substrate-binding protein [Candidatus Dormibacteria bacterium]